MSPSTHPGLLGICLSGAGPTILALATANYEQIAQVIMDAFATHKISCRWMLLEPALGGAEVKSS